VDVANVQAGQRVLIHGGSAGVGAAAVQIAKHFDADVTATCSGQNMTRVRELGADRVIDYTATDIRTCLQNVDVALDPVGGEMNLRTYEVMRPGGTLVLIQLTDQLEHQNRERLAQQYQVVPKPVLFDTYPEGLDRIRELVERGKLDPNVRHVLPLDQVQRALDIAETRHPGGRIVLQVI
jgi:NADPH:quinone reductase-like Zn-dependent oxidoreductase